MWFNSFIKKLNCFIFSDFYWNWFHTLDSLNFTECLFTAGGAVNGNDPRLILVNTFLSAAFGKKK